MAQAQWLVDTQLGPQFQLDDPDNCLPRESCSLSVYQEAQ